MEREAVKRTKRIGGCGSDGDVVDGTKREDETHRQFIIRSCSSFMLCLMGICDIGARLQV